MLRVAARLLADTALVAGALFVPAGTLAWQRAWVLLAVLLLVRGIGAYAVHRVSPGLLRERAGLPVRAGQPAPVTGEDARAALAIALAAAESVRTGRPVRVEK